MMRVVHSISNFKKKKQQGFSLLEVAIVLTILGIVGGLCLPLLRTQKNYSVFKQTQTNQDYILHAIAAYVGRHGRFSCPAELVKEGRNEGVAQVSCRGKKAKGYIPFKTLGISETYTKDGNKQPMIYAVESQLTQRLINLADEPGGSLKVIRDDGSSVISPAQAGDENSNYVALVLISLGSSQEKTTGQGLVFHEKQGDGGILRWESRDQFLKYYVRMK